MSYSVTEATVFYGPIVNPKSTASFLLLPNALLAVASSGSVDWIEHNVLPSSLQDVLARHGSLDTPLIALKHGEFLLPGFVDTHTVRVLSFHVRFFINRSFPPDSAARTTGPEHRQVSIRPLRATIIHQIRYQRPAVRTPRLAKGNNLSYGGSIRRCGLCPSSVHQNSRACHRFWSASIISSSLLQATNSKTRRRPVATMEHCISKQPRSWRRLSTVTVGSFVFTLSIQPYSRL